MVHSAELPDPRGFCLALGHTAVATKPFHQCKERSLLLPQPSARGFHLDGGEHRQGLAQVLRADQHLAQADQVAAALAQPIGHQSAEFIALVQACVQRVVALELD